MPPQSPVAWANFINGAGPGSHGIFDFIHRHPQEQCAPFYSAAETVPGEGSWEVGDHRLQLDFWPFNHKPPATVLRRQGTPFWDYLDAAGIPSTFYDLPSNYPASPSHHGHHRCICGMGTPDMLGTYGTYQYFAEDGPAEPLDEGGGKRSRLTFEDETARAQLVGPEDSSSRRRRPDHDRVPRPPRPRRQRGRDRDPGPAHPARRPASGAAGRKLDFELSTPCVPAGAERQRHLPVLPPGGRAELPALRHRRSTWTRPPPRRRSPSRSRSSRTSPGGWARSTPRAFRKTTRRGPTASSPTTSSPGRRAWSWKSGSRCFDYAVNNYDDGLLFFYFSSSDLQSHIFWWDSDEKHPIRSDAEAKAQFGHVRRLYQKLDAVIGDLVDRYGGKATIIVMSDHGFANFGRQFNLNSWLRDRGYLGPRECTSIMRRRRLVEHHRLRAGHQRALSEYERPRARRHRRAGRAAGSAAHGAEGAARGRHRLNGQRVIRGVYRSDQIYSGNATALAPDLIVGYARGYRASWATCLGDLTEEILLDNDSAWSADHCADALEVPGVLFCNRPIGGKLAVAGRHRPVDPGRVRPAHAAADGRQERLFR